MEKDGQETSDRFSVVLGRDQRRKITLLRAIASERMEGSLEFDEVKSIFVEHEIESKKVWNRVQEGLKDRLESPVDKEKRGTTHVPKEVPGKFRVRHMECG